MEYQARFSALRPGNYQDLSQRETGQICFPSGSHQVKPFYMTMIFLKRLLLLGCVLAPIGLLAEDLDSLAAGASSDLQKALAELSSVRHEIEVERLPLARQVTELEQKLTERKAEFAKAQRFQENQLVELNAL